MFAPEFFDDPYPFYGRLRDVGPLVWLQDYPGGGAWLATWHATVGATLRDPRLSASRAGRLTSQFPAELQSEFNAFDDSFSRWMLFLDSPRHTDLRRLMNQGFRSNVLAAFRSKIEHVVHKLLDNSNGRSGMDFIREFAHPLPALVIAEMLDVEPEDREKLIKWSDSIADFFGNVSSPIEAARAAQDGIVALTEYFRAILPDRRCKPGADLISLLLGAEEEGLLLSDEDLLAQCCLMLFAGHETTRNLLGNGLLALLRHREQWEMLGEDRSLLPGAIRELLRFDSPVQCTTRRAREDIVLCDQQIRTGQPIVALLGSGNRDPRVFTSSDKLDITRKEAPHLAFGAGPHVCLGAALTYLEAEVAFNALLDRLPNLVVRSEIDSWRRNFAFRGLDSLPVQFST